jgi:hypothetical protein
VRCCWRVMLGRADVEHWHWQRAGYMKRVGVMNTLGRGNPCFALQRALATATMSSPAGTTLSTTLHSRACAADTCTPDVIISMAASAPMRRGRRCVPCPPGRRPMLTSGKPTIASDAITWCVCVCVGVCVCVCECVCMDVRVWMWWWGGGGHTQAVDSIDVMILKHIFVLILAS